MNKLTRSTNYSESVVHPVQGICHNVDLIDISGWLVNLVTNEFEKLSEGGLIILSCLTGCQLKVNFSEVHAETFWNESFEEFVSKLEADSISFCSSGALEGTSVNAVDVEGDPVLALSIGLVVEVLINSLVNAFQGFKLAISWLKDKGLLLL